MLEARMLLPQWRKGGASMVIRTIYCPRCAKLQGVKDWRERRDTLVLELEPCGHVVERCAREEWVLDEAAAA
jgi:hypothetical protein